DLQALRLGAQPTGRAVREEIPLRPESSESRGVLGAECVEQALVEIPELALLCFGPGAESRRAERCDHQKRAERLAHKRLDRRRFTAKVEGPEQHPRDRGHISYGGVERGLIR